MLDAIEKCVSKLNVDHIRIDGSTQNDVRTVSIAAPFHVFMYHIHIVVYRC